MTSELRRGVPLLILFVVGLAAGIWVFIAPWAVGYPTSSGWSASVWTSVWAGGAVAAVSAVGIVALLARMLFVAQRPDQGEVQP